MGSFNDKAGLYEISIAGEHVNGVQRIIISHDDMGFVINTTLLGTIEEAEFYARGYIDSHSVRPEISGKIPYTKNAKHNIPMPQKNVATQKNMRSFSAALTLGFVHGSISVILETGVDIRANLIQLMQELDKRIIKLYYEPDIANSQS